MTSIAHYHLPGLFEFFEFYKVFLPLWQTRREFFYDWCDIASIYGAPGDCLWGGGRLAFGDADSNQVYDLMNQYGISARLTFSNSLLRPEHLSDKKCNKLCEIFSSKKSYNAHNMAVTNGVIVHSDLLKDYLLKNFPELYLVSSTTKVITDFQRFAEEVRLPEFKYVVPDFRLNKNFSDLKKLCQDEKNKVEFLCNECCSFYCKEREEFYKNVSRRNLGEEEKEHECKAAGAGNGYRFSLAMRNPAFIGIEDIKKSYLPMGFSNFKIEGRGLGSALLLEFILYYMTKPEHQLEVREALYLDSMLDLF